MVEDWNLKEVYLGNRNLHALAIPDGFPMLYHEGRYDLLESTVSACALAMWRTV